MPNYLTNIVKVTKSQYETLVQGGTVSGKTYDPNAVYFVDPIQVGDTTIPVYIASNGEFTACSGYTVSAAGTANKILLGTASGAPVWASSSIGSTTAPVYVNASGVLTQGSTYAGGTAVTLNDIPKATKTASFYAPTTYGSTSQYLKGEGNGAEPTWQTLYAPTTVGSSGQVWRSNGTTPSWTTVYIPTTTGTAGQLWRSTGSGGAWYTVFSYSNGVLTITNT